MKKNIDNFWYTSRGNQNVPVINELNKNKKYFDFKICLTGQHKQMLKQVLDFFKIKPHLNIKAMKKNQSLENLTSNIIKKIG